MNFTTLLKNTKNSGVSLEFIGRPGLSITGRWSPDYVPESGCITIKSDNRTDLATNIRPIADSDGIQWVPLISQRGLIPTGCEPASATMVLWFLWL
eukprot:gnl/Chilomastix_caulleri/5055.p1 GENE.gnl/Chilomastix_caulleri/5055~~gnl/Chilomastix_caulleri/5055.p1  ORF type:complete len:96 (-),score=7.45 gnl/Chilomastix_caulleri/5055:4-291(-)